jgi:hypothetical protein
MRSNSAAKRDVLTVLASAGMALWFTATLFSQHPNRNFDRIRKLDPFGTWLPNWRFFAPEPSQHDFSVLHRVLTVDDKQTPWTETVPIETRRWAHALWFPSRRHDKALFDVCARVIPTLSDDIEAAQKMYEYRMLKEFVEHKVRAEYAEQELPQGFQFLVVQHGGFDEEVPPEYLFVSEFIPLEPQREPARAV